MATRLDASAAALALDSRALESLKAEARHDARGAARAAARQFEAVFLNQVLKQMRESLPGTDLLASSATRMQTALFDQHVAAKLAERGTGLADVLARHLERLLPAAGGEAGTDAKAALPATNRAAAAAPPASADKTGFLDRIRQHAEGAARRLGVPVAFVAGQAAHESGWGRREITGPQGERSFNLFGIKAGPGWNGPAVEAVTTEVLGGVARKVVQRFRAYSSFEEAFTDYARLLAESPRYSRGVLGAPDAASFARALAAGGYATDPQYAAKLERVIASAAAASRRA